MTMADDPTIEWTEGGATLWFVRERTLDPRTEDRPLDSDVDAADRLLPALAAL